MANESSVADMLSDGQAFTEEQQQYLRGFVSGAEIVRARQGLPGLADALADLPLLPAGQQSDASRPQETELLPIGPDAAHHLAQNRVLAEGGKLAPEEQAKRRKHPLDMWDEIEQHAAEGRFPKGTDVFAFKFHGLF